MIKMALAASASLSLGGALADDSEAGNARPKAGDRFVFAQGDKEGKEIAPADVPLDGEQVLAWPIDPASHVVRDGSRLNQVLLVRVDTAGLDDETRPHAAEGIVAYSSICTHAQCSVTGWNKEKKVLHCFCHLSEYDPRHNAKVVFGPAPRPLPALPVKIVDGVLTAAGTFLGKVGAPKG